MAASSNEHRASFADRVSAYVERVDSELALWLANSQGETPPLLDAMRYAVLDGGKRVRPMLAYASAELLGVTPEKVDPIAAAIEMIHAYSLVHDDLPAMDDDALRRGRPAVHAAFGEATAILVGDALNALAFQVLAEHRALADNASERTRLVGSLARAAGLGGMVGGQSDDIAYSGRDVSQDALEDMFARKTGKLIGASILMPLECATDVSTETKSALHELADIAGICFQIRDDILDVTGTTEELGKPSGSDERNDRTSYPARFGLDAAHQRADALLARAENCFDRLGPGADGLRWVTDFIAHRNQ